MYVVAVFVLLCQLRALLLEFLAVALDVLAEVVLLRDFLMIREMVEHLVVVETDTRVGIENGSDGPH